jgi:hypothetical protein
MDVETIQKGSAAHFEGLIAGGWRFDEGFLRDHYTPLMIAAGEGRADLVALLIES